MSSACTSCGGEYYTKQSIECAGEKCVINTSQSAIIINCVRGSSSERPVAALQVTRDVFILDERLRDV